jgi:hypothetical protein
MATHDIGLRKLVFTTELKPDHEIEQFWLSFKQSIYNILDDPRYVFVNKKQILKHINDFSNYLNLLQTKSEYETIMELILKYLPLYGWVAMSTFDSAIINIFESNVKRCIIIASNSHIVHIPNPQIESITMAYIGIIQCCLRKLYQYELIISKIHVSLNDLFNTSFDDFTVFESFLIHQKNILNELLITIFEHKFTPLLQYVTCVFSLEHFVKQQYNIIVPKNVSYKKIMNYIT